MNHQSLGRISILILGTLLIGCSSPVPAISPSQNPNTSPTGQLKQPIPQPSGQMLPVSAEVIMNGQVIQLEVAQTPAQQEMGLMYRTQLPPNRGMLFPFNPARRVGFWMKNCRIPLDMVFLYQGQVRSITHNAPPCLKDPCPIYDSEGTIDQVIELAGGRAQQLGLKVGDRLTVQLR